VPLAAGDKLGPYEILEPIGKGGMGEVYSAHDPRTGRNVAVKVSAERFSERFDREVRAVASLNHPNICHLYDVGPNYLVMELIEGESPKGPMPLEDALKIARQIADALEAAHEKGITHRDLKPGNIKVKPDGTVKVLDFGLAKIGGAGGESRVAPSEDSPTLSMAATQAGVILGTAAYMSPEQAKGKPVDKRADIWAFGVVLHELLTGERVFQHDDLTETLAAVVLKAPDLERAPFEVRRLLKKCLEKDPKKRLRDIGDVWELLDQPVGPVPDRSLPSRGMTPRYTIAAISVLALALAALAVIHFREQPPERQVLQYTLPLPEKVLNIYNMAVSPDGHYLVMSATGEGGLRLWVRSLDSLQNHALPGTENATHPFWSPDSRYIAFFAQDKLQKISVNGGPTQTLCAAPNPRGGSWGRDNVIVFAPSNGNNGLSRVSAGGGVPVPLTKNDSGGTHRWPLFLPDGRRFLYLANGGANSGKDGGIRLTSLDSPTQRSLVSDDSKPDYLPPSTDSPLGYLLFVRQQTLMAQPVDPRSLESKGDLFPVAERISHGQSTGNYLFSTAANGLLIFQSGGITEGNQYTWFDRTGKEAGTVGGIVPSRNSIALSPEGKRVAIERISDQGSDLWITDMEHSGIETRLTFDPSLNGYPVWSPDGSKVAFARQVGVANLYQRSSNNTGQDELLFESSEAKFPSDWSRDGKFLIFTNQSGKTRSDLWALPMTGASKPSDRKPILLLQTQYTEMQGQLSPDSRWLAYTSNESGLHQVYVQPFAPGWDKPIAGKWQISTSGGQQPRWSGDGKELFYMAPDRKLMAVAIKAGGQSFDRGTPQALFDSKSSVPLGGVLAFGYAVAADGKRFLMPVAAGSQGAAPPLTVVVNWLAWVKK